MPTKKAYEEVRLYFSLLGDMLIHSFAWLLRLHPASELFERNKSRFTESLAGVIPRFSTPCCTDRKLGPTLLKFAVVAYFAHQN